MDKRKFVCDPETGLCHPVDLELPLNRKAERQEGKEIIYIGDPMCSWCWGISNHLRLLKDHFRQFHFRIVVGGLRPGGGDSWDEGMKTFLRHHWEEVNKRSGQPFGRKLFDLNYFNYDTEPSCRAVVASRKWMGIYEFEFFEAVARKFYVENEDPKEVNFYQSICEQFAVPFEDFATSFFSDKIRQETYAEFQLNRNWGVRGYPTVLFRMEKKHYQITHGYSDFSAMKVAVKQILENEKTVD